MTFVGVLFIIAGLYLADSAVQNRDPLGTIQALIKNPADAMGTVKGMDGKWYPNVPYTAPISASATASSNAPAGVSGGSSGTLTASQVYQLARNAGLPVNAAITATAIAGAESGYRSGAEGDVGIQDATWGPSIGLWQIRSLKAQTGTGGPRDMERLTDPVFNASSMASISGIGMNFRPWTTYTSGAYLARMPAATAASKG